MAHSMGCVLAIQMAGDEGGADPLGLEIADIAALSTASSRVVAEEQPGGGHKLSLGLSAMAYHLRVLSFAEECVLAHESTNVTSRNKEAGAATVPIQLAGG